MNSMNGSQLDNTFAVFSKEEQLLLLVGTNSKVLAHAYVKQSWFFFVKCEQIMCMRQYNNMYNTGMQMRCANNNLIQLLLLPIRTPSIFKPCGCLLGTFSVFVL